MNNFFDNFFINVPDTYTNWSVYEMSLLKPTKISFSFGSCYQSKLIPLGWRNYLWHLLQRTNIDQEWFERFNDYWEKILGGRHLWGQEDFHYLRNVYRSRFTSEVKVNANLSQHLKAWQESDSIYTLMHQVNKETLYNQVNTWQLVMKYLGKLPKAFLEYGSGIAPITKSFFTFFGDDESVNAYIADIATLSFHYAQFRFAKERRIKPIVLKVENKFLLPKKSVNPVEVIFCITVFEHLNDPLAVVDTCNNHLTKKGLLIFDYSKSSGGGMDTVNSVKLRDKTLRYIDNNFEVVFGKIKYDQTTTLCIARKK